jgi:hypothetical protein
MKLMEAQRVAKLVIRYGSINKGTVVCRRRLSALCETDKYLVVGLGLGYSDQDGTPCRGKIDENAKSREADHLPM